MSDYSRCPHVVLCHDTSMPCSDKTSCQFIPTSGLTWIRTVPLRRRQLLCGIDNLSRNPGITGQFQSHCPQARPRSHLLTHSPWVVGEGIAYITGAVLYSFKKIPYIHSVFHVFVILGDICHMVATWKMIQLFIK